MSSMSKEARFKFMSVIAIFFGLVACQSQQNDIVMDTQLSSDVSQQPQKETASQSEQGNNQRYRVGRLRQPCTSAEIRLSMFYQCKATMVRRRLAGTTSNRTASEESICRCMVWNNIDYDQLAKAAKKDGVSCKRSKYEESMQLSMFTLSAWNSLERNNPIWWQEVKIQCDY